ncbi:hypothetical protein DKG34_40675 [Streptomyces sp. NWU49]|uniref:Predicted protein n=1 Tax=Streptomyces viridosporus (strain ATCC 14672 / DSM 40746 / JCM 4963 / KCTC 9882 / NRRL B-12104 / FH 1290) TaxID=566461 RepID=D5ZP17_STRV1|nr:predicted protein [Streptomyces viridosporus ATCC 14672]PWJ02068.1 hypothetical protein DKG34_40675 [Streptomyces sp. NWU49]
MTTCPDLRFRPPGLWRQVVGQARRAPGRAVDKSETLRTLIRLADADDQVADHIARALTLLGLT